MNRFEIANYIAIAATSLTLGGSIVVGSFLGFGDLGAMLFLLGIIVSFASYIFAGLLTALKMSLKLSLWGWYIAPVPYSIITFFMTFFVSLLVLVMIPIIPIRKVYNDNMY